MNIIRWSSTSNQLNPTSTTPNIIQETNAAHDGLLIYHEQYQTLICTEHGYAVWNLRQRLRQEHEDRLSLAERRALVARCASYSLLRPDEVKGPPPFEPPVKGLREPISGSLCEAEGCYFVSSHLKSIAQHARSKHRWIRSDDQPWFWSTVSAQTFFTGGGFVKYFAVEAPRSLNHAISATPPSQTLSAAAGGDLQRIQAEWSATREQYRQTLARLDEEMVKQDRTSWFNRTEWPQHLAKRNMKFLAHASRLPDRDELVLQEVVRVLDLLMHQAVTGLSTLDIETRRWLKSAKRAEPDVRPFARLQNSESQDRYTGYVRRLFGYLMRVWVAEQELKPEHEQHGQEASEGNSSLDQTASESG
jgi:hypothetical protein